MVLIPCVCIYVIAQELCVLNANLSATWVVAAVEAEDLCDGFLCAVPGAALAGAPQ